MTQFKKHSQVIIGAVVMVIMVGVAGVVAFGVAQKKLIAPTAPESKPAAASCSLKFIVGNTKLLPTAKPTGNIPLNTGDKPAPVGAPVKAAF